MHNKEVMIYDAPSNMEMTYDVPSQRGIGAWQEVEKIEFDYTKYIKEYEEIKEKSEFPPCGITNGLILMLVWVGLEMGIWWGLAGCYTCHTLFLVI